MLREHRETKQPQWNEIEAGIRRARTLQARAVRRWICGLFGRCERRVEGDATAPAF